MAFIAVEVAYPPEYDCLISVQLKLVLTNNEVVEHVAHVLPWQCILGYLDEPDIAAVRLASRCVVDVPCCYSSLHVEILAQLPVLRFFKEIVAHSTPIISVPCSSCRCIRTAIDHAVSSLHVRGAAAAAALIKSGFPARIPNLTHLIFSPTHCHSPSTRAGLGQSGTSSSGGLHDHDTLVALVAAFLSATSGRLRALDVVPGSQAAATSSTRLSQVFRLPPGTLAQLLGMHPWWQLSLPVNPTATTARPAAASNHAKIKPPNDRSCAALTAAVSTYTPPSTTTQTGQTERDLAFSNSDMQDIPDAPVIEVPVLRLLPSSLRTLTLNLTGRLTDVWVLSDLATSLRSLTLINFCGSTTSHAASLAALTALTALALEWPAHHGPELASNPAVQQAQAQAAAVAPLDAWPPAVAPAAGGAGASGAMGVGIGSEGLTVAAIATHARTSVVGNNTRDAEPLITSQPAPPLPSTTTPPTFWGTISAGLPSLCSLSVKGTEQAVDVRGVVVGFHNHQALAQLSMCMGRCTTMGAGVLVLLGSLRSLQQLSLTYLSFGNGEGGDMGVQGSVVRIKLPHLTQQGACVLSMCAAGMKADRAVFSVHVAACLPVSMVTASVVLTATSDGAKIEANSVGGTHQTRVCVCCRCMLAQLLEGICSNDCTACDTATLTPQIRWLSSLLFMYWSFFAGALDVTLTDREVHYLSSATAITAPLNAAVAGRSQSLLPAVQDLVGHDCDIDPWQASTGRDTVTAAHGLFGCLISLECVHTSSATVHVLLQLCALSQPPHGSGDGSSSGACSSSMGGHLDASQQFTLPAIFGNTQVESLEQKRASLKRLRVSFPGSFDACALLWPDSLSLLPHTLTHLSLEGVACLRDAVLRTWCSQGVVSHLSELELATSAVRVTEPALCQLAYCCPRLESEWGMGGQSHYHTTIVVQCVGESNHW